MEKGWDINQFFCELFRVCILFAGHIQPALSGKPVVFGILDLDCYTGFKLIYD